MGKIFGISNNPVSTFHGVFEPIKVLEEPVRYVKVNYNEADRFVSKEKVAKSNPIIKMKNGFGKLMKHFSHPKIS